MHAFKRDLASLREVRSPSNELNIAQVDDIFLPPRTAWGAFACFIRAGGVVAQSMPVFAGTALAWWSVTAFDLVAFLFHVLATVTFIVSMHLLTDFTDFRRCRDIEDATVGEPCVGSFCLVAYGLIPQGAVRVVGVMALLLSIFCMAMLTYMAGWPVLFFFGMQLLLGLAAILKPLRLAYRVWLYGEISAFFVFGLLPLLTAFYVQSGMLTITALWAVLPFGILCMATVHNYNLVYYRRDWLSRKRTLAVLLGAERGIDLSAVLVLIGLSSIVALVSFRILPLWSLIVLGALPVALNSYGDINREYLNSEDCYTAYRSVVHATILTGILFTMALLFNASM
jgi:1,4-dihydroxy-2-naphthoate octaprenyltransferase